MQKKIALVGGGSAGIGRGIAEGLLGKGFDVILTARGKERLEKCANELKIKFPSQNIHQITSDYSNKESVQQLIRSVLSKIGAPDVLILNTGGPKASDFMQISEVDWDTAYQQQLRSHISIVTAFLPKMQEKKWGRIINISSTITLEPTVTMVLSASFRAALINALKCLSLQVAKEGITINTVCPGAVLTDRLLSLFKQQASAEGKSEADIIKSISSAIPIGRIASAADFSHMAVFLASEDASYLSGTVTQVDGGFLKSSF
jgi:3-oxoacyl-[acyl-carrier protein] reductase